MAGLSPADVQVLATSSSIYSSIELDATAPAGDTGDPGPGGGEAELSDDSVDGGRTRASFLALALVNI